MMLYICLLKVHILFWLQPQPIRLPWRRLHRPSSLPPIPSSLATVRQLFTPSHFHHRTSNPFHQLSRPIRMLHCLRCMHSQRLLWFYQERGPLHRLCLKTRSWFFNPQPTCRQITHFCRLGESLWQRTGKKTKGPSSSIILPLYRLACLCKLLGEIIAMMLFLLRFLRFHDDEVTSRVVEKRG